MKPGSGANESGQPPWVSDATHEPFSWPVATASALKLANSLPRMSRITRPWPGFLLRKSNCEMPLPVKWRVTGKLPSSDAQPPVCSSASKLHSTFWEPRTSTL